MPAILICLLSFPSNVAAQTEHGTQQDTAQEYFASVGKMDAYRMPPTNALRGQRLTWVGADNRTGEIVLGKDGELGAIAWGRSVAAEVFEFAEHLYFMAFTIDGKTRGITIVADRRTGRLVEVISRGIVPEESTHRIQFTVFQNLIKNASEAPLPPLETSEAMAGARFEEQCADDIIYEHIYLNPHRVYLACHCWT